MNTKALHTQWSELQHSPRVLYRIDGMLGVAAVIRLDMQVPRTDVAALPPTEEDKLSMQVLFRRALTLSSTVPYRILVVLPVLDIVRILLSLPLLDW